METMTQTRTTYDVRTRYRAFKVKYLGPTNFRCSRVKITDTRFNKSKTVSYDYQFNGALDIAINYLWSIGIKIEALGLSDNTEILLTEDFTSQIK